MQRMIWIVAILTGIAAFVVWQRGGVKTVYVNGLPQYNMLPNREYILQRDCYIFKLKNEETSYPLLGINDPRLSRSVPALPDAVTANGVGFQNNDLRIIDWVRSGTRFRIVSVRQDRTRNLVRTTFEILLLPEAEHRYPRLDAYWVLNHVAEQSGGVPEVMPEIAAPRVKG